MEAVLISLKPEKSEDVKQEVTSLLNNDNGCQNFIYIFPAIADFSRNTLESDFSFLGLTGDHRNVAEITISESTDDIASFYQMKMSMDERDITRLNIISDKSERQMWHDMCNVLLTPQYSWITKGDFSTKDSTPNNMLLSKVKGFLSTLPPFGCVGIMYSSLIPAHMFHHGFHTRNGGISQIPGMKSLNIVHTDKKKDPLVVVEENRRRLASSAGYDPAHFNIGRAVHGKTVWILGTPKPTDGCDIVITNKPGETIAAPGADCIVMVFADPHKRCCGVCHASWIGTMKGVAMETVSGMIREFGSKPEDIRVVMGPSINSCCFHLPNDDARKLEAVESSCVIHRQGDTKNYVDLQRINRSQLEKGGVTPEHIDDYSLTICTACNDSKFFSYDRDGIPFGNQVGFIGIKSECNEYVNNN